MPLSTEAKSATGIDPSSGLIKKGGAFRRNSRSWGTPPRPRHVFIGTFGCIEIPSLIGGNVHRSNRGETLKNSGLMARANNGANA
jgi:hypothetical protein